MRNPSMSAKFWYPGTHHVSGMRRHKFFHKIHPYALSTTLHLSLPNLDEFFIHRWSGLTFTHMSRRTACNAQNINTGEQLKRLAKKSFSMFETAIPILVLCLVQMLSLNLWFYLTGIFSVLLRAVIQEDQNPSTPLSIWLGDIAIEALNRTSEMLITL